jgi:hypothetical protein
MYLDLNLVQVFHASLKDFGRLGEESLDHQYTLAST